ncbi:MAG: hypothetical protein ACRDND_30340, partial [Streptosporangiaceae bacterium]
GLEGWRAGGLGAGGWGRDRFPGHESVLGVGPGGEAGCGDLPGGALASARPLSCLQVAGSTRIEGRPGRAVIRK